MSIYTINELELNVQHYERLKAKWASARLAEIGPSRTDAWDEADDHVRFYEREIEATKRAIELLTDREAPRTFLDVACEMGKPKTLGKRNPLKINWEEAFAQLYSGLGLQYSPASADLDNPKPYESGGPTAAVCVTNDGFSDIDAGSNLDRALATIYEDDTF